MSTITEEEEALSAAAGGRAKRAYVRRIFSEIAPRYDFLNHVLSANIDRAWRRRAIAALEWERDPRGTYVDLCAGTLDIGAAIAREPAFAGQVIGADFAEPMLRAGAAKTRALPVRPVVADALRLPLADAELRGNHRRVRRAQLRRSRRGAARDAARDRARRAHRRARLLHAALGGRARSLPFLFPPRAAGDRPTRERASYGVSVSPRLGRQLPGWRRARAAHARCGIAKVKWEPLTFGISALHYGERAA